MANKSQMITTNGDFMWEATKERKLNSIVVKFINQIETKFGPLPPSEEGYTSDQYDQVRFEQLHKWSVRNIHLFWSEFWDFSGIIGDKSNSNILAHIGSHPITTNFLPHSKYSFAENILKNKDSNEYAVISHGETMYVDYVTYAGLYNRVSLLAQALKRNGFKSGDIAVGIFPVVTNSLVAKLAVNSLGGVWSSCSPDFGVNGLHDRFGQISPKFILSCDFYLYKNIQYECITKAKELLSMIPSAKTLIILPYCNSPPLPVTHPAISLEDYTKGLSPKEIEFTRMPFNAPAFILYSSGTTGLPKCFLHRNAILLSLMKEHQLHLDIKPGYRLFHYTTCGWMMWNWMTAVLASGCHLALYDGSPFYPDYYAMWKFAMNTKLDYIGLSPKYLLTLKTAGITNIFEKVDLSLLKIMGSAGSPLTAQLYDYVYKNVKKDLHLASFTGGTDLLGCFLHANPLGPVNKGEMQTLSLTMDVKILDDDGKITPLGELTCARPFVTQPVKFMNDPTGEKFLASYYEKYPLKWAHGDLTEKTKKRGYIIHGRSDTVLNPGGVRIGTAEIYRVIETIPEISDSAAVGVNIEGEVYVYLFVVMKPEYKFSEDMKKKINGSIRTYLTTRHVPHKIISVDELPVTRTGKVSELAIRDVLHHRPVKNEGSLENPQSLKLFTPYAIDLHSRM